MRTWSLRLLTVWPWTLILVVLFSLAVDDRWFEEALIVFFIVFFLLGIVSLIVSIMSTKTTDPLEIAKENYRLKLIHFPIHVLLLLTLLADYIEAWIATNAGGSEAFLSTFLLLVFVGIPYLLCCIFPLVLSAVNASTVITYGKKQGILSSSAAGLHLLLHFLPIADIFSAGYLCRAMKNCQKSQ